jgi:ferredoxin
MGAEIFEINPAACTECVGYYGQPRCAAVCPVDACHTDPAHAETEQQLVAKVIKLNPKKDMSGAFPSHFKK